MHECAERLLSRRMLQAWQALKAERRLTRLTKDPTEPSVTPPLVGTFMMHADSGP